MISNKYIFEVKIKAADGNLYSFLTVGANIIDAHYSFNDKVYNGQPFEIVEIKRKDNIVEQYSSNLELNSNYKPTDDKTIEPESAPTLAPEE